MGTIKSAFEIAMARTDEIAGDKEGLKIKAWENEGKKIASAFLLDHKEGERFAKEIKAAKGDGSPQAAEAILRGAKSVLANNFNLPVYKDWTESLNLLSAGYQALAPKPKEIAAFFKEAAGFFEQYWQSREQLAAAIKSQLAGAARSRSQQLTAQTGLKVELQPEELPEYARAFREHGAQLTDEFREALDKIKADLDRILSK
jgi:hypothetical protein